MNFDYINEAFKKLELLNEETFDTSLDGINKLDNFMDQDSTEEIVDIIDPVATTYDEIEDSYIGKVITNCNICHSHIFENKEDIVINEEGIVNPDKECPYCGEMAGFVIVGEIKPYEESTNNENNTKDVDVTIDGTPAEDSPSTDEGEPMSEALGVGAGLALGGAAIGAGMVGSALLDDLEDENNSENPEDLDEASATLTRSRPDVTEVKGTVADVLLSNSDLIDACGSNEVAVKKTITNILTDSNVKDRETADEAIRIINNCRGAKLWSTIGTYMSGMKVAPVGRFAKRKLDASLEENLNNVNVETDDSIVMIQSEENGKVTVSTEPKEIEKTADETIGEISDETIAEIESNNELVTEEPNEEDSFDDVDFDIDEVDEERFDELGESYLKNVYDNVKSFKTTSVHGDDDHIILEGLITFNSGVSKKTGFVFEADAATVDGNVRFIGMNEHFTSNNKAFTLTGSIKEKKLLPESLSYNYHVKNTDGKFTKISGTICKE